MENVISTLESNLEFLTKLNPHLSHDMISAILLIDMYLRGINTCIFKEIKGYIYIYIYIYIYREREREREREIYISSQMSINR
jgi:putative heme iron utilization protein